MALPRSLTASVRMAGYVCHLDGRGGERAGLPLIRQEVCCGPSWLGWGRVGSVGFEIVRRKRSQGGLGKRERGIKVEVEFRITFGVESTCRASLSVDGGCVFGVGIGRKGEGRCSEVCALGSGVGGGS